MTWGRPRLSDLSQEFTLVRPEQHAWYMRTWCSSIFLPSPKARYFVSSCSDSFATANPFVDDAFFSPTVFRQKSLFPQTPFLFPHLSNYCSDKNPNLTPCTLGGHILKAAARVMIYPIFWNVMWKKMRGSEENVPFVVKKWKLLGEKNIPHL